MTSNYGFGYVIENDTNWNTQYYIDTRPSSVYGFTWASFSKAAPNERVYMGGAREVIAFTPPDNTAFVLDPFNIISGKLESVYITPLQGKKKMVAFAKDEGYTNQLWYYNFGTSIVRKWTTPSRGCGIYDDVGSLFTLSKDDEELNSVYALYDEKTVAGWCTNPQISHSYKIIKITFDDVNPLVVTSVKPIQYQTNTSINGFAVNTTYVNASSDYSLYGASLLNSQNAPYMLNLNPFNTDSQLIKAFNLGNSSIYDNFVERRVNTSNKQYTNITAFHASNGITLISNIDESSQTPILTSLSRADSQFATPWMYATSFEGIRQENKILVGHTYLPGQFNNALVTVLENEKYGDVHPALKPGLWFDGRGALTVNDQQNPLILPNEFTVETWFKFLDTPTSVGTIIRKYDGVDGSFSISKDGDGTIRLGAYNGTTGVSLKSSTHVSPNTWYHVAGEMTNSQIRLYINGQLEDYKSYTGPLFFNNAYPWSIGASYIQSIFVPFSGIIDEVRISSVARYISNFTPKTVPFASDANTMLLLHYSGSLQDSSPNNYQINPHGTSEYTNDSSVLTGTPTPTPPTPLAYFTCKQCDMNDDGIANMSTVREADTLVLASCHRSSPGQKNWEQCGILDVTEPTELIDIFDMQKTAYYCGDMRGRVCAKTLCQDADINKDHQVSEQDVEEFLERNCGGASPGNLLWTTCNSLDLDDNRAIDDLDMQIVKDCIGELE